MLKNVCLASLSSMFLSLQITPNNNIVFVSKSHYKDCFIKKLEMGNPTLTTEEIEDKDEGLNLPSLYLISQLQKCPYNQYCIEHKTDCDTCLVNLF